MSFNTQLSITYTIASEDPLVVTGDHHSKTQLNTRPSCWCDLTTRLRRYFHSCSLHLSTNQLAPLPRPTSTEEETMGNESEQQINLVSFVAHDHNLAKSFSPLQNILLNTLNISRELLNIPLLRYAHSADLTALVKYSSRTWVGEGGTHCPLQYVHHCCSAKRPCKYLVPMTHTLLCSADQDDRVLSWSGGQGRDRRAGGEHQQLERYVSGSSIFRPRATKSGRSYGVMSASLSLSCRTPPPNLGGPLTMFCTDLRTN